MSLSGSGRRRVAVTLSVVLLASIAAVIPAGAQDWTPAPERTADPASQGLQVREVIHVDTVDGSPVSQAELDSYRSDADGSDDRSARLTNGSTVEYRNLDLRITAVGDVPDEAVDVFAAVFADLRTKIDLDLPDGSGDVNWHTVTMEYDPSMPSGTLAVAGSNLLAYGDDEHFIPVALWRMMGRNAGGVDTMSIRVNPATDWDYDLDPADTHGGPGHAFSLFAVLSHEAAHGLGVLGEPTAAGSVSDANIFSQWIFEGMDLSHPLAPNSSSSAAATSEDLWFRNSDGTWEKIYAPDQFASGSSIGHLDEDHYGDFDTPGANMTPSYLSGEVNRVDGVVVGLLNRVGYESKLAPSRPTISAGYANGTATVSIAPTEGGAEHAPATHWRVEIWNNSGSAVVSTTVAATNRSVSASLAASDQPYQVRVTALTDGLAAPVAQVSLDAPASGEDPGSGDEVRVLDQWSDASTVAEIIHARDYATADSDTMRLYRAFFDRDPDVVGAKYWLGEARSGVTYDDMAFGFAYSEEFTARYGGIDDFNFLAVVYTNVLGRSPDQDGFDYWYGQMVSGLDRHLVVRWIAASNEFSSRHPYQPTS